MERLAEEDETSWRLYRERQEQKHPEAPASSRRLHYYTRHERPSIQHDTQHALMIDAGSQGTRIHVYEFAARVLSTRSEIKDAVTGRRLSFPTTDSRWTNRKKPGLDVFAYVADETEMIHQLRFYMEPMLQFAKDVLAEKKQSWAQYPIYLKATGGLRTLPAPYRLKLMEQVRNLFRDQSFNPFYFETEHARVISGEEEAIYGWAAVNFVHGTLLKQSEGSGSVVSPNKTYGMLEMGGASTQIAFFQPNGDVMANLFKLQIGSSKHWNVYAHSFLYFGVNGAFERHNARLIADAAFKSNRTGWSTIGVYNPCLPGGSHFVFTSRVRMLPDGTLLPLSSPQDRSILEADMQAELMTNDNGTGDYNLCEAMVYKLLRKEANAWCNFAHDRDCSLAGVYQPPLPLGSHDFKEFIVTSNFVDVFSFLKLPNTASLASVRLGARRICAMSLFELELYNSQLDSPVSSVTDLVQYCFRATFAATFLIDGIGFPETLNVTAIDVINGQKLGWALGSTLYEINTLPWEFEGSLLKKFPKHGSDDDADDGESLLLADMLGRWNVKPNGRLLDFVRRNQHAFMVMVTMVLVTVGLIARRRRRSTRTHRTEKAVGLHTSSLSSSSSSGRCNSKAVVSYGSL